jgi:poly-gamma-glutamate synthesis protein (capsule biosynthesis protein)
MVALTDKDPSSAATRHAAGTHYVEIESAPPPGIALAQLASACRERGAGVAVLSLHWGPELATTPSPRYREFARTAVEAGFDLVHGHSAHLFQGIEVHDGKPILYDTGDFLGDYKVNGRLRNDWSFVFLAVVEDKRIVRLRLIPVHRNTDHTDLAAATEAAMINGRMIERSMALGTEITVSHGVLEVECGVEAVSG